MEWVWRTIIFRAGCKGSLCSPRLWSDPWLRASICARFAFLGLVGVGAILGAPGSGWSTGRPGLPDGETRPKPVASAEVTFDTPRRFAVVSEPSTKRQRLYGVGDVLVNAKESGDGFQVTRIEEGKLQLDDLRTRAATWIAVGDVVPGRPGWRVSATRVLRTVEYRYLPTGRSLDVEPRVVDLRADHAALDVDVPETPAGSPAGGPGGPGTTQRPLRSDEADKKFERTLLGRIRVTPTGDDSYEISAADLNAALERGVQLVAEAWPRVRPYVWSRPGVSLHVESPVADGMLGPRGFRVTSPKLAERGGLQVGDIIVGVNGQPVNSFADVYRVYSRMQRDPSLSMIQLNLERQGRHVTKTYRIR